MKKIFPVLGVVALVLGMVAFIAPVAKAAEPAGTMAGGALTVDIGQLKAINALTITDAGGEITALNDIKIKIPAGVNAVWDQTDTTAVIDAAGATTGTVSTTVTFDSATVVTLNVTNNFTAGDVIVVSGLNIIGHTAASGAATLVFAVDGATYDTDGSTANVTVANGAEDTLTAVTVVPYDALKAATSNYTVNFTIPATGVIPPNGKITLTFPAGFDITAAAISSATGISGTFTAADAGQVLTITRDGTGANATAGVKVLALTGVVNQAAAGAAYTVDVATTTAADAALASATSAAFEILDAPAAIDNLTCEPSGQAGAIWLRWTTTAGTSVGYSAKRALAAMTNDDEFNAGTTITQTWDVDAIGGSDQELVTGLNPNTRYYFAVKAIGFADVTSAISTPAGTTCLAPASAPVSIDSTAPTSRITSPAAGSTVQSGLPLIIKGTAMDAGTSSVQKVEVSLDGGTTWNNATVTSIDESNVLWEYTWAAAQAGTVNIKTRATDWVNNVETPGAGITITVSAAAPAASTTTPTVPTIPTTGMTTTQIRAQIVTIQQQIIALIQELIAQLLIELQSAH